MVRRRANQIGLVVIEPRAPWLWALAFRGAREAILPISSRDWPELAGALRRFAIYDDA